VLYNDFPVADAINKATGERNVGFMADSTDPKLNWRGPLVQLLSAVSTITPLNEC
jgi:hypothetical protein